MNDKKKNGKNNQENEMKKELRNEEVMKKSYDDQPWTTSAVAAGLELDDALTIVPKGSLRRYIVLAMHLEAQQPKVMTQSEARLLGRMRDARVMADEVIDGEAPVASLVKGPWGEVISLMASVKGAVVVHIDGRVPAVATQAEEVMGVLAPNGIILSHLTPQEGWQLVNKVRLRTKESPTLSKALGRFVPEEVLAALFVANDKLGKVLGLTEQKAGEKPISRKTAKAHLRRRMTAYVRCMAASAGDDVDSVRRAIAALSPMTTFRTTNVRKKAKAGSVEEAPEEVEEEDEDMIPAPPPPDLPAEPEPTGEERDDS